MPLLPLEPVVFPESLFTINQDLQDTPERWWVLHTRPRAEKALARRLLNREIPYFLPVYEKRWRNQGRNFSAFHPVFPGYLFLYGDNQARLHALETNMVSQVLNVVDQVEMQTDLQRIYQVIASGASLAPEERLQPGEVVEIVVGPFAGMQGKILTRNKKMRFLIEVRFLQQGVSVEMEPWMIKAIVGNKATALAG
jgi:transcription antitermination factor NusG